MTEATLTASLDELRKAAQYADRLSSEVDLLVTVRIKGWGLYIQASHEAPSGNVVRANRHMTWETFALANYGSLNRVIDEAVAEAKAAAEAVF